MDLVNYTRLVLRQFATSAANRKAKGFLYILDGVLKFTKPVTGEVKNVSEKNFIELEDCPSAYAAEAADAGKVLMVNQTGDGIEFSELPEDLVGATALTDLEDCPSAYAAEAADAGKVLMVNQTGDGIEFGPEGITQEVTVVIDVVEGTPSKKVLSFTNGILTNYADPA